MQSIEPCAQENARVFSLDLENDDMLAGRSRHESGSARRIFSGMFQVSGLTVMLG